jgi:hypothetical protein
MRSATKKRAFLAFWLKQSFIGLQGSDYVKLMFVGAHKPRNLDHMDKWHEDQTIADFHPKIDFSFLYTPRPALRATGTTIELEAIPFPVADSFRLFAALNTVSLSHNLLEDAERDAEQWHTSPPNSGWAYIERNIHEITPQDFIKASVKAKNFYTCGAVNPDDHTSNIRWLRGSLMFYDRELHDSGGMIHQFLAVGHDLHANIPVIGMRKQWKTTDIGTIIPLVGETLHTLATSIAYILRYPPADIPFESQTTFHREVTKHSLWFADHTAYQEVDFLNATGSDLLTQLSN